MEKAMENMEKNMEKLWKTYEIFCNVNISLDCAVKRLYKKIREVL